MVKEVTIRCLCGELAGRAIDISGSSGHRVVCYCRDCQAFARYLERVDVILNANGGTDIYQTSPGRLRIEQGLERLACVRLSKNGLIRWYADCCRTPVGNTIANSRLPFVGLVHTFIAPGEASLDEVLGPVRSRMFRRYAVGDSTTLDASNASNGPAPSAIWGLIKVLVRARLSGTQRPSPFVNEDGAPRAEPTVLDTAERARLESARS